MSPQVFLCKLFFLILTTRDLPKRVSGHRRPHPGVPNKLTIAERINSFAHTRSHASLNRVKQHSPDKTGPLSEPIRLGPVPGR